MNTHSQYLVKIRDLKKNFSGKEVLKGVDLDIPDKGIHGFLGVNGAGKSTVMKCLLRLIDFESKEFEIDKDLKIGYLSENLPLYNDLRVCEYLQFVFEIYSSNDKELDLDELIKMTNLLEVKDQPIYSLSKGYKQRVALAAVLSYEPGLIILDEPFVGLDPHMVMKTKDLLLEISKTRSIFVSSHQLAEIADICDSVSILHHGRVIENGDISSITSKLQKKVIIEAEFENATDDLIEAICEELSCEYRKEDAKYIFQSTNIDEFKTKLSHAFLNKGLIVLSQKEVPLKLDQLFKEVTL